MRVDRCVCFNVPFAELAAEAAETGASSVEALQAHRRFGQKCGLCRPYVRRMLRTGETVFHEVVTDDPADHVG